MAMLAASIVGASLAVHAWHAVSTAAYVDFVTGVWLTLADDLVHGVFYRDLVGPDGYGGTRYFPLFFTSIAALMRMGIGPLAAGFFVSAVAAFLLVTGVRRLLLDSDCPRPSPLPWRCSCWRRGSCSRDCWRSGVTCSRPGW